MEQFTFLPIVYAAYKDSYNSKNENIISAFHWFMVSNYFRTKKEDKETQELCYIRTDLGKIKIQYEKPGLSTTCVCSQKDKKTFCITNTNFLADVIEFPIRNYVQSNGTLKNMKNFMDMLRHHVSPNRNQNETHDPLPSRQIPPDPSTGAHFPPDASTGAHFPPDASTGAHIPPDASTGAHIPPGPWTSAYSSSDPSTTVQFSSGPSRHPLYASGQPMFNTYSASEASSFSPAQYQFYQQSSAGYLHGEASGLSHPQDPDLLLKGLAPKICQNCQDSRSVICPQCIGFGQITCPYCYSSEHQQHPSLPTHDDFDDDADGFLHH